jgi:UDP-N-acetylmuramate--alanine ligase
LRKEYIEAFVNNLGPNDHLTMLPIFYAGGTSVKDISSEDLCREIRSAGRDAEFLRDRSLLFRHLNDWDTYIVFGARDDSLSDLADEIAKRLQ